MPFLENRGIVDLPIVIILAVFLAALIISVGITGIEQVSNLKKKQSNTQNFNKLFQTITEVAYGTPNGKQKIRLNLGTAKIEIQHKVAQLKNKKETIRAEKLPLPLLKNGKDNYAITSGNYQVKLAKLKDNSRKNYRLTLILTEISK